MKNVVKVAWNSLFGSAAERSMPIADTFSLPPYDQGLNGPFLLKDSSQDYVEAKVRYARSVLARVEGGQA